MSFFPQVEVSGPQAAAMARALFALAAVDGVHPRELMLIEAFYRDALPEGGRPEPISPAELATALPGADERLLFVKTALLVAHVHGSISDAEARLLQSYAHGLGVTDGEIMAMEYDLLQEYERKVKASRKA